MAVPCPATDGPQPVESAILCSAYEMKKRKDCRLKFEERRGVRCKVKDSCE
jgi:hypothetical protein